MRIGPANMPRFSGNLSDSQVRDVVAYVTREDPAPDQPRWGRSRRRGPGGRGLHRPPARCRGSGPHLLLDRGALVSDATKRRSASRRRPRAVPHQGAHADRHPERSPPRRRGQEPQPGRGDHRPDPRRGHRDDRRIRRRLHRRTGTPGPSAAPWAPACSCSASGSPPGASTSCPRAPSSRSATCSPPPPRSGRRWRPPWSSGRRWWSSAASCSAASSPSGSGIFGIVALFPLLRSLGPLPGTSLDVTDWRKGSLLVDSNGRSVNKGTLVVGGIMTVYPEGQAEHQLRPGRRPDGAHPGPGLQPGHRRGPGDLGPRGLRGLLQAVHPPRLPGRPLRAAARAVGLPVPPVHVQRAQRGGSPVRPRSPPAARSWPSTSTPTATSGPRPATTRPSGPASTSGPRPRRTGHEPLPPHREVEEAGARPLRQGGQRRQRAGRPARCRQGRPRLPGQDLPRPLVVHAGRDRPVLVRGADGHRHLPGPVLRALDQPGHLPRHLRAAAGPDGLRGLRVDGQHLLRGAGRLADPPDAPLGGRHLRRLHRGAHGPHLLHRGLPQAPRAQLDSSAPSC